MKKILVPVDFTAYSENAIRVAGYFADVKGMEVRLLHIVESPSKGLNIPFVSQSDKKEYLPEYIQSAEDQMTKMASRHIPANVLFDTEVRKTSESITDELLKEECDVIIMGRKRPENHESIWSGSIAEKMVRLSSIPVITVGELKDAFKIKNIAFASDFSEEEVKPVLLRVLDLAQIFDADLHLVYVQLNRNYLNNKQTENKVREMLEKLDLQNFDFNIYVADSAEEGIMRYTDDYPTDLLVMCTHGRTGLAHFFRQSISENISAYGSVPVLTYNIKKDKIDRATQPIARTMIRKRSRETKNL